MGAGAKILGSFEVGDHCTIAANAVLLKPLEDNITAAGVPARVVKKDGVAVLKKDGDSLSAADYNNIKNMETKLAMRLEKLEREVAEMKSRV